MKSFTDHHSSSCHDQRRQQQQHHRHRSPFFPTPISINISLLLILISTSQSLLHPVTFTRRLTTLLPRGGGASNGCESSSSLCTSSSSITPLPTTTTPTKQATTPTTTTKILAIDSTFIKPRRDSRRYRAILLSNNLKVLLISDDSTDVEAGSVHVKAGHFNDPDDRAGLAHFHEHMLFLGTAKYPMEDEYETFLSSHGGSSNAYTDMEDTNYYFSVAPLNHDDDDDDDEDSSSSTTTTTTTVSSALSGALDRLSQFFISPLFATDAVERELRAVDSEYVNGCSEESWRQFSLMKSSASPDHPFSKFGCGNYHTLTNGGTISTINNDGNNNNTTTDAGSNGGSSPSPALRQFWEDNYHAGNMQLCVVGRATLDDLQEVVERYFNDVRTLDEAAAVEITNGATATTTTLPTDLKMTHDNDNNDDVVFKTEHAKYGVAAFGSDRLGMIRDFIPLTERRLLKIQFATPPVTDPLIEKSHPHRVISHLIGHESPHSLHHLLNDHGYINGLSSGTAIDTSDFSLFGITISLTPHGMAHRNHVLDLLFLWISMIKSVSQETMASYHDELRRIAAVNFEWREMGDPVDLASSAADLMGQISDPAEILVKGSRMGEYDDDVVRAFLNRLKPENALVTVYDGDMLKRRDEGDCGVSAEGAEWMTERWYGARYRQRRLTEEEVMRWNNPPKDVLITDDEEALRLPKLNEFIPTDFSLACDKPSSSLPTNNTTSLPIRLIDTPRLRLWHKMDDTYRVPKTHIKIQIISPGVYRTPRSMTLNRLYQRVLADDLNSFVYDASLAGCHYRVACTPSGYTISLSGYSEKLQHLLDVLTSRMLSLLDEMKSPHPPPDLQRRFQKARVELLRETKNFKSDAPYEVANYNGRIIMEEKAWVLDSYIEELEGEDELTVEECATVVLDCLTGRNRVEALCMGNIDTPTAHRVASVISSHFFTRTTTPLRPDETPIFRSLRLPSSSKTTPTVHSSLTPPTANEKNNAVEYTLQLPSDYHLGYQGIATLELLTYLGHNSAFSQLRTREQLGYIASCQTRKTAGGGRGMSVIVQSSTYSPKEMEERIERWIASYRKELESEYTEERLKMEATAIAAQLLERDVTLSEEVGRYWGEISASATEGGVGGMEPKFDRVERLAEEFTSNKDWRRLLLDFFDEYLVEGAEKRRVLSVRVYGIGDGEEGWKEEWKREYNENKDKDGVMGSHEEVLGMKARCGSWPVMPYWAKGGKGG